MQYATSKNWKDGTPVEPSGVQVYNSKYVALENLEPGETLWQRREQGAWEQISTRRPRGAWERG